MALQRNIGGFGESIGAVPFIKLTPAQQQAIADFQAANGVVTPIPGPTTQPGSPVVTNQAAVVSGQNTMLLLGVAAVGAFLLLRKKKSKVSGMGKSKILVPALIGGAAILYLISKKQPVAAAIVTPVTNADPGILPNGGGIVPIFTDGGVMPVQSANPVNAGGGGGGIYTIPVSNRLL